MRLELSREALNRGLPDDYVLGFAMITGTLRHSVDPMAVMVRRVGVGRALRRASDVVSVCCGHRW